MKKSALITVIFHILVSCSVMAQTGDTCLDFRDGKTYKTVVIGEQTWLAENIAYKVPSGGCWAYAHDAVEGAPYGYLYNWEIAILACPDGWHLPTDAEWDQLIEFLGGDTAAVAKMKEKGSTYWTSSNTASTNTSGFSARAAGFGNKRDISLVGVYAGWWSTTETGKARAWSRSIQYDNKGVQRSKFKKKKGLSVRCVKNTY